MSKTAPREKRPAAAPPEPPSAPAPKGESDLTAAVRSGAHDRALALALVRWQTSRAPSLAALIDRLTERMPGSAPEVVTTDLGAGKLADAERLVVSTATLAPDPRVAGKLTAMLLAPPFTSLGSRGLWTPVLEALADRHADPRTAAALAPVAAEYTRVFGATKMGEQMTRGVRRLLDALAKRFPAVSDDEEAQALLDALQAPAPKPAPRPTSGDELLAAVYRDPDDDPLRLVYADWLLEQGDPRGEFITLQMRRHRGEDLSAAEEKREAQLLKKHMKDWLGPLYGVTRKDDNVFARGFLEKCVFQPRNPASAAAADHPAWATVRELDIQNGGTNDSGEGVLAKPAMRHLRVLRSADGPLVEALAEQRDFALETLHVGWFGSRRKGYRPEKARAALYAARGLPRLRRLELNGYEIEPAEVEELFASPLAPRLAALVVDRLWDVKIEPLLAALRAAPPAVTLELHVLSPALLMVRGPDGAYARVDGAAPTLTLR